MNEPLAARLRMTFRVLAALMSIFGLLVFIGADQIRAAFQFLNPRYVVAGETVRVVAVLTWAAGVVLYVGVSHGGSRGAKLYAASQTIALLLLLAGLFAFAARSVEYHERWDDYVVEGRRYACVISRIGDSTALAKLFQRQRAPFTQAERSTWNTWGATKGALIRWRRPINEPGRSFRDEYENLGELDIGSEAAGMLQEPLEVSALVVPSCENAVLYSERKNGFPPPPTQPLSFWSSNRVWWAFAPVLVGLIALGGLAWLRWLFAPATRAPPQGG